MNTSKSTLSSQLNKGQKDPISLWFMQKCMEVYRGEMKIHKCLSTLTKQKDNLEFFDLLIKIGQIKVQQIENLERIFLIIDLPIGGKNNVVIDLLVDKCMDFTPMKHQNTESIYQMSQTMLSINAIGQSSYSWMAHRASNSYFDDLESLVKHNLDLEKQIGIKLMEWSINFDSQSNDPEKQIC